MEQHELPERWTLRKLPELADLKNGGTPSKVNPEYWKNGSIPFVTAADCTELYVLQGRSYLTEQGLLSGKTVVCEPGDVLIGTRTRVGNCSIVRVRMGASQDLTRARLNSICIPEYLCLFIRNMASEVAFFSQGTSIQGITRKFLKNLAVPIPPVSEQRRIVARIKELTRHVEEAQGLRREAVAETTMLSMSGLNRIFLHEKIHAEFRKLGEVADIKSGVTLGRRLNGPKIKMPYLRVANVQDGHLNLSEIKEVEILKSERNKWLLKDGDILLTEGGDWDKLGRGAVWRNEIPDCIHQNHIFRVRVDQQDYDPGFLCAYISSSFGKAYFQQASKQTTNLASINQRQLRGFKVPRIPLPEQRRIVEYLNSLQAKANNLKRLQAETEAELAAFTPALLAKALRGEL